MNRQMYHGNRKAAFTLIEILLVIISALLVLLVLLHKGKGGGLSDLFGGGISSSLGGSSAAERNLDRITIADSTFVFEAGNER